MRPLPADRLCADRRFPGEMASVGGRAGGGRSLKHQWLYLNILDTMARPTVEAQHVRWRALVASPCPRQAPRGSGSVFVSSRRTLLALEAGGASRADGNLRTLPPAIPPRSARAARNDRVPDGHLVRAFVPVERPYLARCEGGVLLAQLKLGSDDWSGEFDEVAQDVRRALSAGVRPVHRAERCGSLSDLFAPSNPAVAILPGVVVWVFHHGTLEWTRSHETATPRSVEARRAIEGNGATRIGSHRRRSRLRDRSAAEVCDRFQRGLWTRFDIPRWRQRASSMIARRTVPAGPPRLTQGHRKAALSSVYHQ